MARQPGAYGGRPGYGNYYSPYYSPYGYGAFGLGYFYYDPFWDPYFGYPGYGGPPIPAYPGAGYPTGELRLQVHPEKAEVRIDGYYAGVVDDFDGMFQSLTLAEGTYQVEITAPGYEPLAFNVRVFPGRKVTYRGELLEQKRP